MKRSELEDLTFDITALMDEEMEVYSSTVLKILMEKQTGKLNTLEYLFKFLDAYDFSADASVEINDKQQNKTLINASVLGLIFEKSMVIKMDLSILLVPLPCLCVKKH